MLCCRQPVRRGRAARQRRETILSTYAQAATRTAATNASLGGYPAMTGTRETQAADRLLDAILASLDDDKAEDILTIPLAGKSEIADHMVICSGRSSRQVQSIAEKLTDRLKHDKGVLCKVEGQDSGDWVLIDAGDVIVHVFRPEVREFYQLEKMWLPQGQPGRAESAD
jgi:ribosome-associated protein